MSAKKKVQFDRRKKVKKFTKDEYSGSDLDEEENSDIESGTKKSKHSLDSDEEDNTEKYKLLNREFMNEIGQEAKTKEFDDDIKLTPFNMKEELEEGDFDTDGYYISKKADDIKDAWLDNIEWGNVNTFKKNANLEADAPAQEKSDSETESEDALSSIHSKEDEKTQLDLFKNILTHLERGETVLRAIKRLGNSSGGNSSASTSSQSASQKWLKKKQQTNTTNQTVDPEKVKANKKALETLTGFANQFIDQGFYDIYDMTYEKIQLKLREAEKKDSESFDIFAENVDANVLASTSSKTQNIIEDSIVKWVYKLENTDESKLNGPFTSLQMLEKAEKGEFKETGVWCRKLEESAETAFYNSKRIDFDLYT